MLGLYLPLPVLGLSIYSTPPSLAVRVNGASVSLTVHFY
jgi:hypothetical protein